MAAANFVAAAAASVAALVATLVAAGIKRALTHDLKIDLRSGGAITLRVSPGAPNKLVAGAIEKAVKDTLRKRSVATAELGAGTLSDVEALRATLLLKNYALTRPYMHSLGYLPRSGKVLTRHPEALPFAKDMGVRYQRRLLEAHKKHEEEDLSYAGGA